MNNYCDGKGGRISPSDVFSVSTNVSYLDSARLEVLEQSFRDWIGASRRVDTSFSRARMLYLFMLLRYTGARLGEVLSVSDEDILIADSKVRLGAGECLRRVPIPAALCSELALFLDSPARVAFKGKIFDFDQGHIRRYFYERAQGAGLAREMGAPRVIRNSRAVEMLRSGVPLTVVSEVMGQASLDFAHDFQCFTESDVSSIVKRLALDGMSRKTSARNTFIGHVTQVDQDGLMAAVSLETETGIGVHSLITVESLKSLGIEEGSPVVATVKAPQVGVCPASESGFSSARNCFRAKVARVQKTAVMAEVSGRMDGGAALCALVSADTVEEAGVAQGDSVIFFFKSLSVVLNTL